MAERFYFGRPARLRVVDARQSLTPDRINTPTRESRLEGQFGDVTIELKITCRGERGDTNLFPVGHHFDLTLNRIMSHLSPAELAVALHTAAAREAGDPDPLGESDEAILADGQGTTTA